MLSSRISFNETRLAPNGPRQCGSVSMLYLTLIHTNIICYLPYEWKIIRKCCAERQTDEKMRTVSNLTERRWWITMNSVTHGLNVRFYCSTKGIFLDMVPWQRHVSVLWYYHGIFWSTLWILSQWCKNRGISIYNHFVWFCKCTSLYDFNIPFLIINILNK